MKKQNFFLLLLLILWFIPGRAQTILTMDQAMDIAQTNSPSLMSARYSLEQTAELLNAQRAALKSNFLLNVAPVGYSNTRQFDARTSTWFTSNTFTTGGTFTVQQPILATDGVLALTNNFNWRSATSTTLGTTAQDKSFINNANISLTQPLFTYNRTKVTIKTLELNHENAMLNYAMQRLSLEKTVAQYFYNVYLAQMGLTINQEAYKNNQMSHDIIKNKVDAGLSALGELYQADVSLATAQSSVESSRVNLESAKDIFKQYIGLDIFQEMAVVADITVTPIVVDAKKAMENGLAARMEIRQRQINVETSLFTMLSIKALNEFRGDMKLSVGIAGDDPNLVDIYKRPTNSPAVSLAFNIPLYDWGEKKARIRSQDAAINASKLGVTNQVTQIKVDIRQSVRNLENLKNQIDIALVTQKNSQLTYDINLERYKNGDLTSMDLNLFQQQLSTAKMSYAQSLINYKIELLNLKITSLYDFTTNEPVVPEKYFQEYRAKINM
jgi:outer membrane protein